LALGLILKLVGTGKSIHKYILSFGFDLIEIIARDISVSLDIGWDTSLASLLNSTPLHLANFWVN